MNRLSLHLMLVVLMVTAIAAAPLCAQSPASATVDDVLAPALRELSALNTCARALYEAIVEARILRDEDPAKAPAFQRVSREEQLAWQLAYRRGYKWALIGVYDHVTDETSRLGPTANLKVQDFQRSYLALAARGMSEQKLSETAPGARIVRAWRGLQMALDRGGFGDGLAIYESGLLIRLDLIPASAATPQAPGTREQYDWLAIGDGNVMRAPVDAPPFPMLSLAEFLQLPPGTERAAAIRFEGDFLEQLQALIDPVEQEEFSDQLELERLDLKHFEEEAAKGEAAPAIASVAPSQTAANEAARTAQTIEHFEMRRRKLIGDVGSAFQRLTLQARSIRGAPDMNEFFSYDKLRMATMEEVEAHAYELVQQLKSFEGQTRHHVREQLARELDQWRAELADLTAAHDAAFFGRRDLRLGVLAMQNAGKELRQKNLKAQIMRDEARAQVAASLVTGLVKDLAAVDMRIGELRSRERGTWYTFMLWAAVRVAVIILIAWLLIRVAAVISGRIVRRLTAEGSASKDQEARARTLSTVFMATIKVVVWVTAMMMMMGEFNVNYGPLLLATGGITLAIGFGAQSLVKDFVSGFFILLENQFRVGDVVEVCGKTGSVESLNLRTTRIRAGDGTLHIIQNGQIDKVSNMTQDWARINMVIGVGYNEDPDEVAVLLNRIGKEMYDDPAWRPKLQEAPTVTGLDNFGASSMDIRVMGKTNAGEQWAAAREYRRRVKIAFDLEGVELPYNYVNYVDARPGESKVLRRKRDGDTKRAP